ncbi:MAG TPA: hypothetical protein VED40_23140 [Azospirillaceae bacterium]|nr:hypothetical protein [Azospirillaceae bacterium]
MRHLCILLLCVSIYPNQSSADYAPLSQVLAQRERFRSVEGNPEEDKRSSVLRQRLAAFEAIVGNYEHALEIFEGPRNGPIKFSVPELDGTFAVKPADLVIADLAKGNDLLSINEAHHVAAHRSLLLSLLERLYSAGYRHLALEGLNPSDSDIHVRGFAEVGKSGAYLNEPTYGEIVRRGLELGFQLIAYDNPPSCERPPEEQNECANDRQRWQAASVERQVRASRIDGKIVLLVGYSHGALTQRGGFTPMASILAVNMGLRHLSVDQTTFGPFSQKYGTETPTETLARRLAVTGPFVLTNAEVVPFVPAPLHGLHSIVVFWPNRSLEDGRPAWLVAGLRRKRVIADISACEKRRPMLVQAIPAKEPETAVPVDQVLMEDLHNPGPLYLRSGRYRIVCRTQNSPAASAGEIEVLESSLGQ